MTQVSEIILNEPLKLNSLDYKMIRSMLRKIRRWVPLNLDGFSSDDNLTKEEGIVPKIVIMSGAGKAFCAGGDIATLYRIKKHQIAEEMKVLNNFFRYEYLLDYSLTKMTPIQIAIWQGAVMGGGVGLSIHAPFRVATETTVYAMPGI